MTTDYDQLRLDEMASISETLAGLTAAQWDAPSLCDGWRVRDVIGHMLVGYTVPMDELGAVIQQYGGDINLASKMASAEYAGAHSPSELASGYERLWRERIRGGIAAMIPIEDALVDHVIHHSDMCRPLGLPTGVSEERLAAVLQLAPVTGGMIGCDARMAGLRLHATDLDLVAGDDGPEVAGSAEDLILAVSGRPAGLDRLEGDGVATLVARVKG
jgi:uncharacterized protein (TIGR03083 family)